MLSAESVPSASTVRPLPTFTPPSVVAVAIGSLMPFSASPTAFASAGAPSTLSVLSVRTIAAALSASALAEAAELSALFASADADCAFLTALVAAEFALDAAETASSFALIAPATVLSSLRVAALIGVPSFVGSSFRIRVTISDVPSDFTIVHRPGYFATRSSKTILSISCHVFTGKRNVCFSKRFDVKQNLLDLIHC